MDLVIAVTIVGAVVVGMVNRATLIRYAAVLALVGIAFWHTRFAAMAESVLFLARMQGQSSDQHAAGVAAMLAELRAVMPELVIVVLALALLACRPVRSSRGGN